MVEDKTVIENGFDPVGYRINEECRLTRVSPEQLDTTRYEHLVEFGDPITAIVRRLVN
jgi:hypothetical protein